MPSLFEFSSGVGYLEAVIEEHRSERGYQTRLAAALRCQRAYITHILKGRALLTPDQGMALARHWSFSDEEAEFFLALVNCDRAATPSLRDHLRRRIEQMRAQRREVAAAARGAPALGLEMQMKYYAQWYWSAIHIIVSIPEYGTPDAIAARLGLARSRVVAVLSELELMGLVRREPDGRYAVGTASLHLSKSSPCYGLHHANWRTLAARTLPLQREENLHYTSVFSISRADFEHIRSELLEQVKSSRERIAASRDEELACLALDLFLVGEPL